MKYLGDIYYGGKKTNWGKGAIVNDTVYLSGVDGIDPETDQCPSDIQRQTGLVLDKIKERLGDAGTDVNHIVRFVTYIVGRENLDGHRSAKETWMKENYERAPPAFASTLLLVEGLARPDMKVEIDVTAVLP